MMEYTLIKSNRKTIALSFNGDGGLVVKAPYWVSQREIDRFVREKRDWIDKTGQELQRRRQKQAESRLMLENGDVLYYLGEPRLLSVIREDRTRARVVSAMGRILLYVPYDADYALRQKQLEKWFRREALEVLTQKAEEFAARLQVRFSDIRIKDQKSRWGSCSSTGNLNFNWRLVTAPEPVCDYVVIHELCHLRHMDHSAAFWGLVESICPDYREYKKWLKENADKLYLF